MTHTPPSGRTLADVLEQRKGDVLRRWEQRVSQHVAHGPKTQLELEEHILPFLQDAVRVLRREVEPGPGPVPRESAVGRVHGHQRFRIGFELRQLVREYDVLRGCIFDLVEEEGVSVSLAEVRALTSFIASGIDEGVEEHQRQSEARERLSLLLQHAPVGICMLSGPDHVLSLINPLFLRLVGGPHPLGQRLGQVAWRLPDGAEALERVFRSGKPFVSTAAPVSLETAEGTHEERFFHYTYQPVLGQGGQVEDILVLAVEVTELVRARLRAEALSIELRREESRLREATAAANVGTWWNDLRTGQAFQDASLNRIMGLPPEPSSRPIEDLFQRIHPEDLRRVAATVNRAIEERGVPMSEYRIFRPDGSVCWLRDQGRIVTDETGAPLYMTGAAVDITHIKRAEQVQALFVEVGTVLTQSLDMRTTLKNLADLAITHLCDSCTVDLLGADGQLQRVEVTTRAPTWREPLREALACPPSLGNGSTLDVAFRNGQSLFVPELSPEWLTTLAPGVGPSSLGEAMAPRAVAVFPLVARGRQLGLICMMWSQPQPAMQQEDLAVAQEVASRAALAIDNARLYQEAQEAIRAREDVVAIVSHDLRNPLNAISLTIASLMRREHVDPRTAKMLDRILAAAERAGQLIQDVLDFTQARMGQLSIHPEPLEFHTHVRGVVEEIRLANPGRLIEFQASGEGAAEGDKGRLAQVVTNLVGNALQHSPPDTVVRVVTRGEPEAVVLTVHNEGAPINAAALPTLFEPYRRGPGAGEGRGSLGLGLFITRQIILGHGGTIQVRSQESEGTSFTVQLPRRQGAAPPAPQAVAR